MKKKISIFQKVMKSILTILVMLGVVGVNMSFAYASSYHVTYTEVDNWKIKGGHYDGDLSGIIRADDEITWCIENHKNLIDGENSIISASEVGLDEKDMQILSLIAYYGYRVSPTVDHYMLTQNAIWAYTNKVQNPPSHLRAYNIATSGFYSSQENINEWIDRLMEKVNDFYQLPSFAEQTYEMKANQTLTLTDENSVLGDLIIDSQSEGLEVEKRGQVLKITASNIVSKGTLILKRPISDEQSQTNFVVRSGAGGQAHSRLTGTIPYQVSIHFQVVNEGHLKIVKKDDQGNVVPHTQFQISYYADMSQPIGKYTTENDGAVIIPHLKAGQIYVQEVKVPEHLVLDENIYSVFVEPGETITFTAKNNWKKGYIRVTKKDNDSGKIVKVKGTIFEIYDENHQKVSEMVTDETGIATSGALNYGTYYVKEVKAPYNYIITTEVSKDVTITENNKVYDITFVNQRARGTIYLSKEDSVMGKDNIYHNVTLKGAVYGVFAKEDILDPADHSILFSSGEKVTEMVTDKEGNASVSNLYLGTYEIQEIKPSEGYNLDSTRHNVSLLYENQNKDVIVKTVSSYERVISQPFSIIKISSQGTGETELLQGAEFTVKSQADIEQYGSWEEAPIAFNADGKPTKILVTDEQGYAKSDRLPVGTYVVRETKTPPNKYPVPDFKVTITKDGSDPLPYKVLNDQNFESALAIVKKDKETNKIVHVEGAKFRIKNLDTSEYLGYWQWNPLPHYVTSWQTDESGCVVLEETLKPGHYQLEELEGPQGYILNQTSVSFQIGMDAVYEILPDGKTPLITIEMSDLPVKGRIEVKKEGDVLTDYKEGQFIYEKRGLARTHYHILAHEDIMDPSGDGTILYLKGTLIEELVTGQDGKALSSKLPLGKYDIIEIKAPYGYSLNKEKRVVELKYKDDLEELIFQTVSFQNERQHFHVNVKKVDSQTNVSLQGAEFAMYAKKDIVNVKGQVIVLKDTQISKAVSNQRGEAFFSIDLPYDCEFYIQEIKAPLGYASSLQRKELNTHYQGQDKENVEIRKVFQNSPIIVEISKQDITSGKEIAGNHLSVVDKNGMEIDSWISEEGKTHLIYQLHAGETYTLVEKMAASGYVKAKNVSFTVKDTKQIQRVEMKNDCTRVEFQKVNVQGIPLAGAKLAIVPIDDKGQIQEEKILKCWETKVDNPQTEGIDESIYRIEYLPVGHYALIELSAPKNYVQSSPIRFEVKETTEIQNFVMTDKQVFVSKINHQHQMLEGTCLQVVEKETGKLIDQWTTNKKEHAIVGLEERKTYVLNEIKAPYGYQKAKSVEFIVTKDKKNQVIEMVDEYILTQLEIYKIDSETKKAILSHDFEMTLYSDKACTRIVAVAQGNGKAIFQNLRYGTYYLKETRAPQGYMLTDEVKTIVIDDFLDGVGDIHTISFENTSCPIVVTSDSYCFETFYICLLLSAFLSIKLRRKVSHV